MWKCSCPVAVLLSPFKVLESDFSTGPAAAANGQVLTVTYYKFRAEKNTHSRLDLITGWRLCYKNTESDDNALSYGFP